MSSWPQKQDSDFAKRLHSLARTVYRSLPTRFRAIANPAASWYDRIRRLRLEVWRITGEERESNLPLSIGLCVLTKEYKSYLLDLIFGSSFQEQYFGRIWIWNVFKKIPQVLSGCSAIVAEIHESHLSFLGSSIGFVIPAWVTGETNLPLDPRMLRHKSVQSDIRKIRHQRLEFEITRAPEQFADFYQNMYIPHIERVHGEGAFFASREALKAHFDNGDLLMVKKQDDCIAGMLITYSGGCPHLRCLGVRDGNPDYVSDGAIAAAYEFSLRYLEEKGYRKVRLGLSRAFLRDGVIRYKKKWSQRIVRASTHKFCLKILSDTDTTRVFLQNTPFIFESLGKLSGAIFVGTDVLLTPQLLQRLYNEHFHIGLSRLVVFTFRRDRAGKQKENEPDPLAHLALDAAKIAEKHLRYEKLSIADSEALNFPAGCTAIVIYPEEDT